MGNSELGLREPLVKVPGVSLRDHACLSRRLKPYVKHMSLLNVIFVKPRREQGGERTILTIVKGLTEPSLGPHNPNLEPL